jgi:hypothetical protein
MKDYKPSLHVSLIIWARATPAEFMTYTVKVSPTDKRKAKMNKIVK